jgi:hypothetical protein
MNRARELVDDAVTLLRSHGLDAEVTGGGDRHIKVRWLDQGRRHTLIISQSPSNRHARLKSLALLRRLLRANGTPANGGAP